MTERRVFVGIVVVAGAAALGLALLRLPNSGTGYVWLPLALLTWLSAPLALKVPGAPLTVTVSETLSLIIVFGFGWEAAAVTLAVDGLVTSLRQRSRRVDRTLFNVAEPALSMMACGAVLDLLSALPPAARMSASVAELLIPCAAGASVYLLLNGVLMSAALAIENGTSVWRTWRASARWLVMDHLGATSLALLVVAAASGPNLVSVLAALPALCGLYFTYRSSIRKADEALAYVNRLNTLYLETVESLATAIDAKDQVTHGHIQRVRLLARRLIGPLGITDESVIQALEAGALLHDVGKLGVPDHILNKAGPLTPAEYDEIKRHTVIGADIVSRVAYPYPVAPIVRHHHENWDGTGYPDGLCGEQIPIGARVLSVVDCYDALTSDRPYRKAMTHSDAAAIVADRRGTMYDPRVVDAFLALPLAFETEAAGAPATVSTTPVPPAASVLRAISTQALAQARADDPGDEARLVPERKVS